MTDLNAEILIVGAGPAGLSAAESASNLGGNVLVIERSSELGYPVHTSGGSWIKEMREFGVPERYYNPIRKAIFSSPSHDAEFSLQNNAACILNVRSFYQYLATKAISNGANLLLRTSAISLIEKSKDKVTVKATKSGKLVSIHARVCIDCSGFHAVIGRSVRLVRMWKRYGLGAEYEAWVENVDPSTTIFLVGTDVSPAGYAWIFPLGEHRIRIGVGVIRPDVNYNPLDLLNKLLIKPTRHVKSLGRIVPLELHLGSTPADGPVTCSVRNRILLAGDAAGQVMPHVGEGIRFAMLFGKMAGQTAISLNNEENLAEAILYDKKWKAVLGSNAKVALRFQRRLAHLSDEQWNRGVEMLKSLSPKEFIRLLRWDVTGRFFIGLLARHPKFASSLTMRLLLKSLGSR